MPGIARGPGLPSRRARAPEWDACRHAGRRELPARRPHPLHRVPPRSAGARTDQDRIERQHRRFCPHPARRIWNRAWIPALRLLRPIEAGSYTLLVNGRARRPDRQFRRRTLRSPASPAFCARTFPVSEAGRPSTGNSRLPAVLAPDGTPYEAYTLTTDGAGTLTVAAGSAGFHARDRGPLDRRAPAHPAFRQPDERRAGRATASTSS